MWITFQAFLAAPSTARPAPSHRKPSAPSRIKEGAEAREAPPNRSRTFSDPPPSQYATTETIVVLSGAYGCASQDAQKPAAGPVLSATRQEPHAPASHVLLADGNGTLSAIDTARDEVALRSRSAVISPSGTLFYEHRRPSLTITDLETLQRVGRTSVPKGMELQVASTSERYLARSYEASER